MASKTQAEKASAEEKTEVVEVDLDTASGEGPPPMPPEASEPPLDAVLVVKKVDSDGNLITEVAPHGDVRPTEVETLLKLGLKKWQSQLGL